ncbi:MAG TPA: DUF433 domain-containing protein [Desulfobacterales bacterium]|nr:DUF433 domain-containing protein [Desulfobacterales bacterium]
MLAAAGELYESEREAIERALHTEPPTDPRHPYICQQQSTAGYEPTIKGTRITVRAIVEWYNLYQDVDRILAHAPHLSKEQIEDALSYYTDHKEEIDFFIAENDEEYQQYLHKTWEKQWKGFSSPSILTRTSS